VPNVYTYDNEGNRTSQGGTYDTGNRVLTSNGFTYTHDLDGNIIRKYNSSTGEDHQYTWSSDGRLTDVYYNDGLGDSPLTVHYDYNAYGQPVLRLLGSSLDRVWVYDRGQLLGEFNAANGEQRVAEYLYNPGVDDPYGVITGATTPTKIDYLKLDESGSVLGAYEGTTITMTASYDDWGVASVGVGQAGNLLWKSLHHDEYTGLYYARARWYDPSLGRFMSEDPAGFAGGVNPYTFADDDPINGRDPSGMFGGGSIMNAYNSCGIYCEFAVDFYHNRQPSKLPPPGRIFVSGVNPGLEKIGGAVGILGSVAELRAGGITIGSNLKPYLSGWHGNGSVSTVALETVGKNVSRGAFGISVVFDGIDWASGAESGRKALVNIGFAGVAAFAGTPGAVVGGTYWVVDKFVPGGWEAVGSSYQSVIDQNQAVFGPGWNPSREYGGP